MQNSRLVELAIKGLEEEKARIEQEIAELTNHTTARTDTSRTPVPAIQQRQLQTPPPAGKPRRKMSAAARKKISEAMKKRHAERKAAAARRSKSPA